MGSLMVIVTSSGTSSPSARKDTTALGGSSAKLSSPSPHSSTNFLELGMTHDPLGPISKEQGRVRQPVKCDGAVLRRQPVGTLHKQGLDVLDLRFGLFAHNFVPFTKNLKHIQLSDPTAGRKYIFKTRSFCIHSATDQHTQWFPWSLHAGSSLHMFFFDGG